MDLANVTLTQLRYVIAVDRFRSFRLAAKHCHVSQPALSMQLGKLEELLDLVLFDRSRQPVVPTARGAPVVAQARAILHETERLAEVVRGETEIAGRYRLGIIPSLAPTLVPRFSARLLPRVSPGRAGRRRSADRRDAASPARRLLDGGVAVTPLGAAGRARAGAVQGAALCLPATAACARQARASTTERSRRRAGLADGRGALLPNAGAAPVPREPRE